MSFLDKLLGKKGAAPSAPSGNAPTPAKTAPSEYTIPSNLTAQEFGKVNVFPEGQTLRVQFTILMEPEGREAEGWQTGVSLDASASMREWFGLQLHGKVPPDIIQEYEQKKWVEYVVQDGSKLRMYHTEAHEDAIRRGFLRFSANIVQPVAQEFIAYLAGNLDADGGTTVIYWACGDGSQIEVLGDYTEVQCHTLEVKGPQKAGFGEKTCLTPALQYFVERFSDAKRGMYVFITDGKLDDLEAVKQYTTRLAQDIEAEKANPVKCVLIGVGNQVDEAQMIELDNLDTGTDIDIWDHKIAKEMRDLKEIFAEVVDENQIVAPTATAYDSDGKVVKVFSDGLPARTEISLPGNAAWFDLEVAGRTIRQTVILNKP